MPDIGMTSLPGYSERIYWQADNAQWHNVVEPTRFLIEGVVIPEPASILLLTLGGLFLRKRK